MLFRHLFSSLQPAIWFDQDSGGAGGGGDPDKTKELPHAGGNGGASQEELNRQFGERAKRAEEAERARLFKAVGVETEEELRAMIEAKRKEDEAKKSEIEKAAAKAAEAEAKLAKLEAERKAEIDTLTRRIIDGEIKALAGRKTEKRGAFRAEALDDVLLLIDRAGIAEKDGKLAGVEEALAALAKAKPYMLDDGKQPPKGSPVVGGQPAQPNPDPARRPAIRF